MPFASFIKNFFSKNKKFGSNDRKQISNLCYSFFRLGKLKNVAAANDRILTALAMQGNNDAVWIEIIKEAGITTTNKTAGIFPWKDQLSETIDATAFEQSFLIQPDLFLRVRPGAGQNVLKKLHTANIPFIKKEHVIRLSNNQNIAHVLDVNKEVVVQDYSSQQVAGFLSIVKEDDALQMPLPVYDCCAASGGKSILAKDILGDIALTVSDIRPSIIANLKKRFQEAGITNYAAQVADLTQPVLFDKQFSLVIADVPCTGSGTWARTPEQLYYFEEEKIESYAQLQKNIIKNVEACITCGGYLLYITCSVFKQENEEQVKAMADAGFSIVQQQLLKGYNQKADTLFAALLKKKE